MPCCWQAGNTPHADGPAGSSIRHLSEWNNGLPGRGEEIAERVVAGGPGHRRGLCDNPSVLPSVIAGARMRSLSHSKAARDGGRPGPTRGSRNKVLPTQRADVPAAGRGERCSEPSEIDSGTRSAAKRCPGHCAICAAPDASVEDPVTAQVHPLGWRAICGSAAGTARSRATTIDRVEPWDQTSPGVFRLPSGRLVRGRGLRRGAAEGVAPEFELYLQGKQPPPMGWSSRSVRWPDWWMPETRCWSCGDARSPSKWRWRAAAARAGQVRHRPVWRSWTAFRRPTP